MRVTCRSCKATEVWELDALIAEVQANGGNTGWRAARSALKCPHHCASPWIDLLPLPMTSSAPGAVPKQILKDCDDERCRASTKFALRLLTPTAARPNEVQNARWLEIENLDDAEPLWRIPAARMKGDADRKATRTATIWCRSRPRRWR